MSETKDQRLSACAQTLNELQRTVHELENEASLMKLVSLHELNWYQVLTNKLLPQVQDHNFLIVAVVGGTNIGKSVVFNHIAGCRASATVPLASGTKHPTCLVPPGFTKRHNLSEIFKGFEIRPWSSAESALIEEETNVIYFRESKDTPENLLILDTPDIDSDAPVNWERAAHIQQCADVLIAVLTQQKYNDAAIKQFFRHSAEQEKSVVVLFNQCQLPEDEKYWKLWLNTFTDETGVQPEYVYLAPFDREAAESNQLKFYERSLKESDSITDHENPDYENSIRNLSTDLSKLHFSEIKVQTLQGSIKTVLDQKTGLPSWLREIRHQSQSYRDASEKLSEKNVIRIKDWPTISNHLLVDEIRCWWKEKQEGWAKNVHTVYDKVSFGIAYPFKKAKTAIYGPEEPLFESYQQLEWTAILRTVDEMIERLTWLGSSGNEILKPHFNRVLAGNSRSELIKRLKQNQEQFNFEEELKNIVQDEMNSFEENRPELYKFYKKLNTISAAVRPATSVVMFSLGWGPAGEILGGAIGTVVADFAGGTAAALMGETAVTSAAGQGMGFLQAKFQKLQTIYTEKRAAWLVLQLKEHFLGSLPEELLKTATLSDSDLFKNVEKILDDLKIHIEIDNP